MSSLLNWESLLIGQAVCNLQKLVSLRSEIGQLVWKELVCMNVSNYLGLKRRKISEVDEKFQLYFKYF